MYTYIYVYMFSSQYLQFSTEKGFSSRNLSLSSILAVFSSLVKWLAREDF